MTYVYIHYRVTEMIQILPVKNAIRWFAFSSLTAYTRPLIITFNHHHKSFVDFDKNCDTVEDVELCGVVKQRLLQY